jgi:alanine racemase
MDLSAVECGEDVRVGDRAEILGPQVDIWAQARAAQTIPYELLTSLAARVSRKEKP